MARKQSDGYFQLSRRENRIKMRDIFYCKSTTEEHKFVYTGLEFYEFMRAVRTPIENIILLEGNFVGEHSAHCFEVLKGKQEIQEFQKESVKEYGNFCFVDCKPETEQLLNAQEIAELLYLSHMFQPMSSPFFSTIDNHYAYLAHDDGYFGQLYCKQFHDFSEIITSKIEWYLKEQGKHAEPIDSKIKDSLLEMTKDGLLIDLRSMTCGSNQISIDLFLLGNETFASMDDLYNHYDVIISQCSWKGRLQLKQDKWSIKRN